MADLVKHGVGGGEVFVLEWGAEAEIFFDVHVVVKFAESICVETGSVIGRREIADRFVASKSVGEAARSD